MKGKHLVTICIILSVIILTGTITIHSRTNRSGLIASNDDEWIYEEFSYKNTI